MIFDPEHTAENIIFFSLFLIGYYLLYRKQIFSIFDPLAFLVFNISSTSFLIIQDNVTFSRFNLLQFFLFQILFWYGFSRNKVDIKELVEITFADNEISLLEQLTMILFSIFLVANIYLFFTVGAPVFAEDPTIAKIDYYAGGLGLIRRINWGVANFSTCSAMVLSIVGRHKKTFISIVLIQMLFLALGGSKGGTILSLIFTIALLSHRNDYKDNKIIKNYIKLIYLLLPLALVVGTLVLYVTFNDIINSVIALGFRGLMAGDVVLYYYQPEVYNSFYNLGFFEFVKHEANPVLGFFRLASYEIPIGYQMVARYLESINAPELLTTTGPNFPFYVEANVYFGFLGGLIYSFIIGYIVSFVRKLFFSSTTSNIIHFVYLFNITTLVMSMYQDTSFFVIQSFDSMLIPTIVLGILLIVNNAVRSVDDISTHV